MLLFINHNLNVPLLEMVAFRKEVAVLNQLMIVLFTKEHNLPVKDLLEMVYFVQTL